MASFEDFTDFKEGNWNGWENGPGIRPGGELKSEKGQNTMYWSGRLVKLPNHPIGVQPSLFKVYDFDAEERKARYEVSFDYRLHPLKAGEAKTIGITITTETVRQLVNVPVGGDDELGTWHHVTKKFGESFRDGSKQLWLGTRGGQDFEMHRAIDLDNIRLRRVSTKSE